MKALMAGAVALVLTPILFVGALISAWGDDTCTPCKPPAAGTGASAAPFPGPDGYVDDPTSSGRITRRTLYAMHEIDRAFGPWPWGIHCWDPHTWNPASDHSRGRACDYTVGRLGRLPSGTDGASGWRLARWLRANADRLGVAYVIWDGQIWTERRAREGWRTYSGGGVYNTASPTGGHYDHVHLSVRA